MSCNYEFKSCFALYINQLITKKREEGYIYETERYILSYFDQFCIYTEISEVIITKQLITDWETNHNKVSQVTLCRRITVLRQLSLYMCSMGIECYVPSGFSAQSNLLAYVLTEDEIKAFFYQVDNNVSKINADRLIDLRWSIKFCSE